MYITERRLNLHEQLCTLLGTRYVYFQPPESLRLHYPCIVYQREENHHDRADDRNYRKVARYNLIFITPDPDDALIDAIEEHFPMCRLGRPYAADNLNHYPYQLYF